MADIEALVGALTLEEKAVLTAGRPTWATSGAPRSSAVSGAGTSTAGATSCRSAARRQDVAVRPAVEVAFGVRRSP